jgi:large subunit ribosomal protein L15
LKYLKNMNLSNLQPAEGSTTSQKRIGRGQGSGRGGTSTRGHKGQKSRSGYSKKIGFEGGQMPLQRVVPKSGFKNINRVEYKEVNLDELQKLADKGNATVIDREFLISAGVAKRKDRIKILGGGSLTAKLEVKAHAFSKSAKEAIEKVQGTTEIL